MNPWLSLLTTVAAENTSANANSNADSNAADAQSMIDQEFERRGQDHHQHQQHHQQQRQQQQLGRSSPPTGVFPLVLEPSPFPYPPGLQRDDILRGDERQPLLEEPEPHRLSLEYDLFSQHQHQHHDPNQASEPPNPLQDSKRGDSGLDDRSSLFREEQHHGTSAVDDASETNPLDMIGAPPVWPNTEDAYTVDTTTRRGEPLMAGNEDHETEDRDRVERERDSDDDDDGSCSDPIPLQRSFHPVQHSRELREFARDDDNDVDDNDDDVDDDNDIKKQEAELLPALEIPAVGQPPPLQRRSSPSNFYPHYPSRPGDHDHDHDHGEEDDDDDDPERPLPLGRETPPLIPQRAETPGAASFESNNSNSDVDVDVGVDVGVVDDEIFPEPGPRVRGKTMRFDSIAEEDDRFGPPPHETFDLGTPHPTNIVNPRKRKRPRSKPHDATDGITTRPLVKPRSGVTEGAAATATATATAKTAITTTTTTKWTGSDTYIRRVHDMLEEAIRKNFAHVVSWQPHGRAFKIHQRGTFEKDILPIYFHTEKPKHFYRWLTAWGFLRHTEGADRGAYYHRYFVRGVILSMVTKLSRDEMLRSMEGWMAPGTLPDFYGEAGKSSDSAIKETGIPTGMETDQECAENVSENDRASAIPRKNPKYLRGTVLEDLRLMLEDAKSQRFTNVVGWLPGGKTFKIHDKKAFQRSIASKYMKTSKLSHFSDNLRRWGFCRLKETPGEEENAYYHRLFQEGKPELCRHMSRTQMLYAMNDFKEEQKRQKEISWSLFPHHRQEKRVITNDNKDVVVHDQHKISSEFQQQTRDKSSNAEDLGMGIETAGERDHLVGRTEVVQNELKCIRGGGGGGGGDDFLHMGQAAALMMPNPPQYYLTRYLDVQQQQQHNGSKQHGVVDDIHPMDLSMRHNNRFGESYCPDPSFPSLPPDAATDNDNDTAVLAGRQAAGALAAHENLGTMPVVAHGTTYTNPAFSAERSENEDEDENHTYAMRVNIMLEQVETKGEKGIVSWMPHGRAFKIHDERAFESEILPRYFKATIRSFKRCLLHWGFVRLKTGRDRRCWYHRLFVRGVFELIRNHTRQSFFDAMKEWRELGNNEPDLYSAGTAERISELPRKASERRDGGGDAKQSTTPSRSEEPHDRSCEAKTPNKNRSRLRGTFVEDLRGMLDACLADGDAHIVGWLPHGKSFRVHEPREFEARIMKLFFKASKYRYFTDGLRSWGFVRLNEGRDKGSYHHKFFVRDEPELSHHRSRAQMKASMKGWSQQSIRDFYDH